MQNRLVWLLCTKGLWLQICPFEDGASGHMGSLLAQSVGTSCLNSHGTLKYFGSVETTGPLEHCSKIVLCHKDWCQVHLVSLIRYFSNFQDQTTLIGTCEISWNISGKWTLGLNINICYSEEEGRREVGLKKLMLPVWRLWPDWTLNAECNLLYSREVRADDHL